MTLLALSLSMVIVSWCDGGNSLTIVGGGVSSVSSVADMGVGQGGGHKGQHSNIVGVASGVGVVDREAVSDLTQSVGIGLSLSLAIVDSVVSRRDGGIGVDSGGIGVVSAIDAIAEAGHNSDIVGVASSIGVVDRESSSNLAQGVGISLSFPLAVVSSMVRSRNGGIGVDSRGMGVDSSVANGANSRDEAVAIVNPSDDTAIGGTMGDLAQSVCVTAGAGDEGKNKGEGFHVGNLMTDPH